MNIILITEFFPESSTDITGGIESRAYNVAKELAKKHTVYVLTSYKGKKRQYKLEGINVLRVGPKYPYTQTGHLTQRMLFSAVAGLKARALVNKRQIHVVEGCSFFAYPSAFIATVFNKAKRFLTYHEVWIGSWIKNTNFLGIIGELFERKVLFLSKLTNTNIIAVSDFTKQLLVKHGIKNKNIHVIHNGVDLEEYKFKTTKYKKPTICFTGRITEHKRVIDLIKAVKLIKQPIQCKIVGLGPAKAELEKQAPKNVEFLGFLDEHKDVLKVMKKSHIFCSPSVVEGFGITLLEAIACQTPFVCSDIPPYKEVSKDKGGLFFKPKNPQDLALKLSQLFKDKKLYNKCTKEQKEIIKHYNWKNISYQVEKLYSK